MLRLRLWPRKRRRKRGRVVDYVPIAVDEYPILAPPFSLILRIISRVNFLVDVQADLFNSVCHQFLALLGVQAIQFYKGDLVLFSELPGLVLVESRCLVGISPNKIDYCLRVFRLFIGFFIQPLYMYVIVISDNLVVEESLRTREVEEQEDKG